MKGLDAIKARLDAATPGPWFRENVNGVLTRLDDTYTALAICRDDHNEENNAKFIANAPDDMRRLIARVERLEAALEQIEAWTRNPREYEPSLSSVNHIARTALAEEDGE